ncbi:hypothetical protein ARMGADRAFT_1086175 [Armillaria gallica]|uniref:Uncharacterized protein n=1 Tax=Armillaria gallica TaxID=47427 RepID=A0A2H3D8A3_ARMGA|nr:hypothetical protein ARMGADRAFT_1086175 [Armillaria gallica]
MHASFHIRVYEPWNRDLESSNELQIVKVCDARGLYRPVTRLESVKETVLERIFSRTRSAMEIPLVSLKCPVTVTCPSFGGPGSTIASTNDRISSLLDSSFAQTLTPGAILRHTLFFLLLEGIILFFLQCHDTVDGLQLPSLS